MCTLIFYISIVYTLCIHICTLCNSEMDIYMYSLEWFALDQFGPIDRYTNFVNKEITKSIHINILTTYKSIHTELDGQICRLTSPIQYRLPSGRQAMHREPPATFSRRRSDRDICTSGFALRKRHKGWVSNKPGESTFIKCLKPVFSQPEIS